MKNYQRNIFVISIVIFLFQIYPIYLSQAEENKTKDATLKELEKFAENEYPKIKPDEIETTVEGLTDYHQYRLDEKADILKTDLLIFREKLRYSAIFGLMGAAVISLLLVLFRLKNTEYRPDDILNATGLILIIFGTIIVVIIADVGEQLTAAVGILGAISGYLFGTIRKSKG